MFEGFKRRRLEDYDKRIEWATRVAQANPELQTRFRIFLDIITAEVSVIHGTGGSIRRHDIEEIVEHFLERHGL